MQHIFLIFHLVHLHAQRNFSGVRELDSVAEQVYQDLAKLVRIPLHNLRHLTFDFIQKLQLLFGCSQCEGFQYGFQTGSEIKVTDFQIAFPSFDFGEVKNVVDHAEQRIAR